MIAKTYELQRRELKLSTDALNDQVKLAALTALLNSNLTRISLLESEKIPLLQSHKRLLLSNSTSESYQNYLSEIERRIYETESRINGLKEKNNSLEGQIEYFLMGKPE